jgi:hypothetical protein
MKKFYYFVFVLFFGACSVTTEDSSSTNYGTNEGSASSPVELTVGTAKSGSVGRSGYSYYKFTTTSGAGSYKLAISSLSISDSYYSSASMYTSIYSNSGYTSTSKWNSESCLADCTLYFDYINLDNNTSYYLQMQGYGAVTYSLTVSKGGSEGSPADPVELTLSTAHTGGVEGYYYYFEARGNSYYKFTTTSADNYTFSMNNSDSLDCYLLSDSEFSSLVSNTNNGCTAGTNISATFKGSSGTGLSATTTYYLLIEQQGTTASAAKTTTYDNMTVAPEG